MADDTALFDFYDQRIPKDVTSARHFDTWWKKARAQSPDLLTLTPADLAGPAADEVQATDYPATWGEFRLSYEFAPGEPDDGVTAGIPLSALGQASGEELSWQVPGRREELVTELIRSLPKDLRRAFVPAPNAARAVLARLGEPHGNLLDALGVELGRLGGVRIPRDAWDLSRLPAHLRIRFRVMDSGKELASGEGPGRAARAAVAPAPGEAHRRRGRHHPHRADRLDHRHAAPGVHPRPGHRLPGAGGYRERGGRPVVRDAGAGQRGRWRAAPGGCSCSRCRRACGPSPTGCPTSRSWR